MSIKRCFEIPFIREPRAFIREPCALCARSLVFCLLYLPAGAVDRTDSIRSRSDLVVGRVGSENLSFWGNAKDKLIVAKMAMDAAHVLFGNVMAYLGPDHVRLRARVAAHRIAALGTTACRKIAGGKGAPLEYCSAR